MDMDAMQTSTSLRRRSLLLSSLPWTTDCVMRPTLRDGFDASTDNVPTVRGIVSITWLHADTYLIQEFLRAIDTMEADLLAASESSELAQICQLLQLDELDPSELQIWSLDRSKGKTLQSRLLSVLVSFRLADVMSWIVRGSSGGVPRIHKALVIGGNPGKVSNLNVCLPTLGTLTYSYIGMGQDEELEAPLKRL